MEETIDVGLVSMFVLVADTASFSRAAARLGVTTSTVSRGIATLERRLSTRLLHRTTRSVALSTAGKALYERTAPHLLAVREAMKKLPERDEEPSGTLRLTAPYDLGVLLLGDVIARYTLRYPKVRVEADFSNRIVDLVAEGFDLAVRAPRPKTKDSSATVQTIVPKASIQLYAAPSYLARRGTPRAIGAPEHDWLLFPQMRSMLGLPKGFEARVDGNDFLFLREAARAGTGVALLPMFIAEPLVPTGDLVRVLPAYRLPVGGLVMLYPSRRPLARKVVAFRELLVEALKKLSFV